MEIKKIKVFEGDSPKEVKIAILEELIVGKEEPYFRIRFEIDKKRNLYMDVKNVPGGYEIRVDGQLVIEPLGSNLILVSLKEEL